MADSKWIAGLTPGMLAIDAARTVLAARLGVVRHYFPLAVTHSELDIEHVHQLRVATRRASAALRIFEPVMNRKAMKKVKTAIRGVRRATGNIRDWDVFMIMIDQSTVLQQAACQPAAEFLTAYAIGQRTAATTRLIDETAPKYQNLDEVCDALPDCMESEDARTLGELADAKLTELLFMLTTDSLIGAAEPEEMHQFRILGKRVRYAMEVFADCYTEPFKAELYPAVEQLQECLGTIQDCFTATMRVTDLYDRLVRLRPEKAKELKAGFTKWKGELRQQTTASKRDFRTWSRNWEKLLVKHPLPNLAIESEV